MSFDHEYSYQEEPNLDYTFTITRTSSHTELILNYTYSSDSTISFPAKTIYIDQKAYEPIITEPTLNYFYTFGDDEFDDDNFDNAEISDEELKKLNTDGRKTCAKCGKPLKEVVGFMGNNLNYCPECEE